LAYCASKRSTSVLIVACAAGAPIHVVNPDALGHARR